MAAACLELLGDEEKRRRFGEAGRRWAVERFSEARVLEQYRQVYQRVLNAG